MRRSAAAWGSTISWLQGQTPALHPQSSWSRALCAGITKSCAEGAEPGSCSQGWLQGSAMQQQLQPQNCPAPGAPRAPPDTASSAASAPDQTHPEGVRAPAINSSQGNGNSQNHIQPAQPAHPGALLPAGCHKCQERGFWKQKEHSRLQVRQLGPSRTSILQEIKVCIMHEVQCSVQVFL